MIEQSNEREDVTRKYVCKSFIRWVGKGFTDTIEAKFTEDAALLHFEKNYKGKIHLDYYDEVVIYVKPEDGSPVFTIESSKFDFIVYSLNCDGNIVSILLDTNRRW